MQFLAAKTWLCSNWHRPRGLEVHLVMDNYGTHKVSKVRAW